VKFTIKLSPVTKKNSQQIVVNPKTKRPFIIPSSQYKQYLKDSGWFIPCPAKPIDYPVNVKAIYYMPTKRKVDLTNLHEALHDILVHYKVLTDDNSGVVYSTDGSRVKYDKENPRTEIEITKIWDWESEAI
jgi:Holliday junction resolvase RusA-like endonuclease